LVGLGSHQAPHGAGCVGRIVQVGVPEQQKIWRFGLDKSVVPFPEVFDATRVQMAYTILRNREERRPQR